MAGKKPALKVLEAIRSQPWAITEDALQTMLAVAHRDHDALVAKLEAVLAERGTPLEYTRNVENRDGVAIVPVRGPLVRYASFFSEVSGLTSMEILAQDFTEAVRNGAVRAIVLDVDSPGGAVNGLLETAEIIAQARGVKPIIAVASGQAASAAYVLAAAADEVVATASAELGSIGGILTIEVRDQRPGVQSHQFVSKQSPKKRPDLATAEGRELIQSYVDSHAEVMIDAIARYRGVTAEDVLERYGQGALLIGQAAIDAGLADRMATTEAVVQDLIESTGGRRAPVVRSSRIAATNTEPQMADKPTPEATPAPAAAPSVPATPTSTSAAAPTASAVDLDSVRAEARDAERKRVLGIQALARSADDKIVAACVADPACTVEAAALKMRQDEIEKGAARMTALRDADKKDDMPSGRTPDAKQPDENPLVAAIHLLRPETAPAK